MLYSLRTTESLEIIKRLCFLFPLWIWVLTSINEAVRLKLMTSKSSQSCYCIFSDTGKWFFLLQIQSQKSVFMLKVDRSHWNLFCDHELRLCLHVSKLPYEFEEENRTLVEASQIIFRLSVSPRNMGYSRSDCPACPSVEGLCLRPAPSLIPPAMSLLHWRPSRISLTLGNNGK